MVFCLWKCRLFPLLTLQSANCNGLFHLYFVLRIMNGRGKRWKNKNSYKSVTNVIMQPWTFIERSSHRILFSDIYYHRKIHLFEILFISITIESFFSVINFTMLKFFVVYAKKNIERQWKKSCWKREKRKFTELSWCRIKTNPSIV